ncbi:cupin domain-containing protein [Legionella drancourtii]|uniref:D-lyxose ketol-isomerase n=1 Tax=Legionella drancourtii LLAP12 TaxID=658187 RepID=G9ELH8_9GAMM|nr:hypothetical protein [Legionella drancourtii]EHL31813.1 hypothetical protein LDG_5977 [Legionella drancourtii LLAP12]
MDDSSFREIIAKDEDFLIFKLNIDKDTNLPNHKPKGQTTIIPIRGKGYLTKNGDKIEIKPGTAIGLTPNDTHCLVTETSLEVLVVEIL